MIYYQPLSSFKHDLSFEETMFDDWKNIHESEKLR